MARLVGLQDVAHDMRTRVAHFTRQGDEVLVLPTAYVSKESGLPKNVYVVVKLDGSAPGISPAMFSEALFSGVSMLSLPEADALRLMRPGSRHETLARLAAAVPSELHDTDLTVGPSLDGDTRDCDLQQLGVPRHLLPAPGVAARQRLGGGVHALPLGGSLGRRAGHRDERLLDLAEAQGPERARGHRRLQHVAAVGRQQLENPGVSASQRPRLDLLRCERGVSLRVLVAARESRARRRLVDNQAAGAGRRVAGQHPVDEGLRDRLLHPLPAPPLLVERVEGRVQPHGSLRHPSLVDLGGAGAQQSVGTQEPAAGSRRFWLLDLLVEVNRDGGDRCGLDAASRSGTPVLPRGRHDKRAPLVVAVPRRAHLRDAEGAQHVELPQVIHLLNRDVVEEVGIAGVR
eukprot:6400718-Prymnesium_polylepis.1